MAGYTITEIPTLGGGASHANDINDAQEVVGSAETDKGELHAFLWQRGTMTDLDTLGGPTSYAIRISANHYVVGSSETAAGGLHAFLWRQGRMTDLGTLGGYSQATGISDAGQPKVVGRSAPAAGPEHAVLWAAGQILDLGTLGGPMSDARDISDQGVIVGGGHTPDRHTHAFLHQGAGLVDIGTLPGFADSYAIKVNRGLQVAGTAVPEGSGGQWGAPKLGGHAHAFLWESGTITDLGLLRGSTACRALSLNNHGQVVGTCGFTEHHNEPHAFLWAGGVLTDLQTFAPSGSGWLLEEARGINDPGWIVGTGKHNGLTRGYVLIPD